jgi:cytochrome P450
MTPDELRMATRTLAFLDAHRHDAEGILELRAKPPRRLLVWHPEVTDWIFRFDRQTRHVPSHTLGPLLGQQSLLWADGARHHAYRRLLGRPLHGAQLATYRDAIAATAQDAIDGLVPGTVFPLPEWTRKVTLRVMGQIVFNQADDVLLEAFRAWINRALGSRSRTLVHRYLLGGLPRSGPRLDRMVVRAVHDLRDPRSAGLAGLLVNADALLRRLDDEELRDQVVSLLFAGHETTASATAWTLYRLSHDDELSHDIMAELAATSDDGADATRLPLLHATIQEVLRLTPPAPVAGNRALTTDVEIHGRALPAGTILLPSIYLAHRQPDLFPDPDRFDPRRFLDTRFPARYYFPFGGGTRHCLGSELAMLEICMITAALLRQRRLRCVNPAAARPQLRGPAMAPSARLRMAVLAAQR